MHFDGMRIGTSDVFGLTVSLVPFDETDLDPATDWLYTEDSEEEHVGVVLSQSGAEHLARLLAELGDTSMPEPVTGGRLLTTPAQLARLLLSAAPVTHVASSPDAILLTTSPDAPALSDLELLRAILDAICRSPADAALAWIGRGVIRGDSLPGMACVLLANLEYGLREQDE